MAHPSRWWTSGTAGTKWPPMALLRSSAVVPCCPSSWRVGTPCWAWEGGTMGHRAPRWCYDFRYMSLKCLLKTAYFTWRHYLKVLNEYEWIVDLTNRMMKRATLGVQVYYTVITVIRWSLVFFWTSPSTNLSLVILQMESTHDPFSRVIKGVYIIFGHPTYIFHGRFQGWGTMGKPSVWGSRSPA